MTWRIVPMTAAHIPALAEIENLSFAAPWSAQALSEELTNPPAVFLVAETADGTPVGYAGMHVAVDEGYFANVAVHPDYRKQGVGDALIAAFVAYGKERNFYRLALEVRVSNAPAIRLYEKHGFVKDGVRPRFYTAPTEDAAMYAYYFGEGN